MSTVLFHCIQLTFLLHHNQPFEEIVRPLALGMSSWKFGWFLLEYLIFGSICLKLAHCYHFIWFHQFAKLICKDSGFYLFAIFPHFKGILCKIKSMIVLQKFCLAKLIDLMLMETSPLEETVCLHLFVLLLKTEIVKMFTHFQEKGSSFPLIKWASSILGVLSYLNFGQSLLHKLSFLILASPKLKYLL